MSSMIDGVCFDRPATMSYEESCTASDSVTVDANKKDPKLHCPVLTCKEFKSLAYERLRGAVLFVLLGRVTRSSSWRSRDERSSDRAIERAIERSSDRGSDRAVERATERPRAIERAIERSGDRAIERSTQTIIKTQAPDVRLRH